MGVAPRRRSTILRVCQIHLLIAEGGDKLDFDHHDDHHQSVVAAVVTVGTVVKFPWAPLSGFPGWSGRTFWVMSSMVGDTVILLLAVGSDYTRRRFSAERGNWGRIEHRNYPCHGWYRGSGRRVGMVFAVTMSLFVFSDLRLLVRSVPPSAWAAVRHPRRALVHTPVHRCAAGTLVRSRVRPRPGQSDASALPAPRRLLAPCCCRPASTRQRLAPARPQVEA